MEVIPVVDLRGGIVVHARLGQRDLYRPIETPLSPTSDPVDVVRGLMSVHPFATLYVADLDAITGNGDNRPALARIRDANPHLTLWIDSGLAGASAAHDALRAGQGHVVLGSETLSGIDAVRSLAGDERVVLSLDFRGDDFQGPPALLADSACWPARVIVMTLDRVGSHSGPDLDRLRSIKMRARHVYAAGGVRHAADLHALTRAGVTGALVASSLHNGRLTADDLRTLQ